QALSDTYYMAMLRFLGCSAFARELAAAFGGDDKSLRRCEVLVGSDGMPTCPYCQQSVVARDGHDRHGRQRFTCAGCGRDFTLRSASAFSGYRWPADVILMAVRWYL